MHAFRDDEVLDEQTTGIESQEVTDTEGKMLLQLQGRITQLLLMSVGGYFPYGTKGMIGQSSIIFVFSDAISTQGPLQAYALQVMHALVTVHWNSIKMAWCNYGQYVDGGLGSYPHHLPPHVRKLVCQSDVIIHHGMTAILVAGIGASTAIIPTQYMTYYFAIAAEFASTAYPFLGHTTFICCRIVRLCCQISRQQGR